MIDVNKPSLLVTGAGGSLGRRVLEILLAADTGPLIASTRQPEKLDDLAKRGVEVRRGDFDEPNSLEAAFAGADRLLLISTDSVGTPGGRHRQHRAAIEAAVKAGVGHIIYTSAPSPRPTPDESITNDHFQTEAALFAAPAGWTILRNNIYSEIILMGLPRAVASGTLVTATGTGGRSYVAREDCAQVAAAALSADWNGRRILDVSGPAAVTQAEIAAIAGELSGRRVAHVSVAPSELEKGLLAAGLPPIYASGLVDFDVDALQGRHALVTPVVRDLTGREPQSVRDFLLANRQALLADA